MTKFGVSGLPTLVLFRGGEEVTRIEGVLPAEPLMQQVRYFLSESQEEGGGGAGQQSREGSACSPTPTQATGQDACAPPARDACAPPARDACAPPAAEDACAPRPRDACAPPPSQD